MRASWRLIAARRDLRLVLSAGLVSRTGDWVLLVGLLYRVYAMTGSTLASALTVLSATAPAVALGPVAGMFADRWDRKHTMITADLLLAAGLLPLLAVRGHAQVPIVYAVMFFEASVEQFFNPAQQAIIPHLVSDDDLMAANALGGGSATSPASPDPRSAASWPPPGAWPRSPSPTRPASPPPPPCSPFSAPAAHPRARHPPAPDTTRSPSGWPASAANCAKASTWPPGTDSCAP